MILRAFLPLEERVSLRTISRLVVLVYLSAGLARDQRNKLVICHTGRELKGEHVEQRLTRAELDKKPLA